jgi:hypothetical protein
LVRKVRIRVAYFTCIDDDDDGDDDGDNSLIIIIMHTYFGKR